MSLSLLLLRHAKACAPENSLNDHDRSLSTRGVRDAKAIAEYLTSTNLKPGLVMCSTARRTRQTLEPILSAWPDLKVNFDDGLYLASTTSVLAQLHHADPAQRVLFIGHNPTMEDLLHRLINRSLSHKSNLAEAFVKYPTGTLAELSLPCATWAALQPSSGQLIRFIKPRTLSDPSPQD